MLIWSHQLTRLGEQLIRDQHLGEHTSAEYQQHRRIIQNNMDAARYLSPQLQYFCQFIIPLGESRPRRLAVIAQPGGQQRIPARNGTV